MSLADELLADLENDDDEEDDDIKNIKEDDDENLVEMEEKSLPSSDIPEDIKPDLKTMEATLDISQINSVRELCKLHDSGALHQIMKQIELYQPIIRKASELVGPVESDPEYRLIVEANNMTADIDAEIATVHKFVRDKYQKRFPELESLVCSPLDYVRAVKELGNDLDQAKNNEILQQFLTQATIMVVSVTASTTQGTNLTPFEKAQIEEACDMAINLNEYKLRVYAYVESRMAFVAPNLSAILGANIAAKLMGVAGGLTKLSKIPACNVQLLGHQKKALTGFAQSTQLPHTGFVYHADIVQNTPSDLRRKAAKLVAAKATLAARVDATHECTDGRIGRQFRDEIERKLDKLLEPPPVKFIKPLPKPIDQSKKKRGGKRVRKMKERYAMTEFRKHANRMNFADIEDDAYQEDLGYTRGTIGKAGAGRIRLPQVDEKTKVRISKTLQKNMQKQQIWGGNTTVKKQISGTASSVAFTPLQGLEIVNPQAAEVKGNETSAKYFSNTSGFLKLDDK